MVKAGSSSKGYQRYRCSKCGRSFTSQTELANAYPRQTTVPIRAQSQNVNKINYPINANLTDVILTLLFGWTGYLHFKKKQIGLGLLWFFTCGLCFVGWIIDFLSVLIPYIQSQKTSPESAAQSEAPAARAIPIAQPEADKPVFPDEYGEMEKMYSYEIVNLYTVPEERPNFKSIVMHGSVDFVQEPENQYDNHAVRVMQYGIKLGYLHRGKIQDLTNNYLKKGNKIIGFVSQLDYQNGVISIDIAYYE